MRAHIGNAKSGNYKQAPSIVARANNKDDPRILRITGFATRKLGDVDAAMPFTSGRSASYNDTLTREYMGEAFVVPKAIHDECQHAARRDREALR